MFLSAGRVFSFLKQSGSDGGEEVLTHQPPAPRPPALAERVCSSGWMVRGAELLE